jgi:TM2 domain-containing membrane protein YozV
MLLAGHGVQALICLILMITIIGWPLAAIWALLVVNTSETEKRVRKVFEEQQKKSG